MNKYIPPIEIQNGLDRYINDGILPGSFLSAVLKNNLKSVVFADPLNKNNIVELVSYMWHNIPEKCWGSVEKVDSWVGNKKLR